MRERRALRQFTFSTGKSAGRNSSGRITLFHRGGGSKRLQRRIDLKRSTSSMGIVERIEYDPFFSNRSSTMERGGPPEKMQHDRRVRSAEKETRIYHDRHPRSICVLFPAREGGSKKGSLLLSWTDGGLWSGRPSYQNAFLVEEPLY